MIAECIGVRLLRREIRVLDIQKAKCEESDVLTTTPYYKKVVQKRNDKIKELQALGYEYIEGWDD